jgi:signal transduction histidine kinase
MKLQTIFKILFFVNLLALFGVVFIVDSYQKATTKLQRAYELQHKSLILADELRQSSDDLTRMARTYVVTGKSMFEEQFYTVLDIRNGIAPRPENYNRIYWDFLTLDGSRPDLNGQPKSLRRLMKEAGFSEDELQLLLQSARESDDLTTLENKAMNAVKGIFQDASGAYTLKGEPDLALATQIMHSDEYHQAKIAIMKPIDQFYQAFERRTQHNVQKVIDSVHLLEKMVTAAIVGLIFLVLISFIILLSRIVYPLKNLTYSMVELSKNNMDVEIPSRELNDEVGAMMGTVKIFKENALRLIQKEEKLKQAIKEARAANHSKSVFLANMSHELRTPLNAILGFSALLRKSDNLLKEEQEHLRLIDSSGQHLLMIINEILELSKIEVGKIEIAHQDFNLIEMIHEVQMMFQKRCEEKGLIFSLEIDSAVPSFIQSDEKRLKQILINLIGNGLKFTQKGSIHLRLYTDGHAIFFQVTDTGVGIKKVDQEKIFKPFEQIESNKVTAQGTGLGLAICKELTRLMGGDISVTSRVGQGSRFSFSIRYKAAKERPRVFDKNVQKVFKPAREFKAIVADDIPQNRKLLVEFLKHQGIESYEARDGLEVQTLLHRYAVDILFLDLLMPNLNGYETLEWLKNSPDFSSIPTIVVSANVFEEDRKKSLQLGAQGFLAKPISEQTVTEVCLQFLDEQPARVDEVSIPLPESFLKELHTMAARLDGEGIIALVEQTDMDDAMRESLVHAVETFDFEHILRTV